MAIKSSSELKQSIFKKLGCSIEYQDLEIDEETGDEDEDSDEGYYWTDSDGDRIDDDLFETKDDAIDDCLASVQFDDLCHKVKFTKAEKTYIFQEFGSEI